MVNSKNLGIRRITKLINYFGLPIPDIFNYSYQVLYRWPSLNIEIEIWKRKTYVYLYDDSTLWKFKTYKIKNNEFNKVLQLIHEYLYDRRNNNERWSKI